MHVSHSSWTPKMWLCPRTLRSLGSVRPTGCFCQSQICKFKRCAGSHTRSHLTCSSLPPLHPPPSLALSLPPLTLHLLPKTPPPQTLCVLCLNVQFVTSTTRSLLFKTITKDLIWWRPHTLSHSADVATSCSDRPHFTWSCSAMPTFATRWSMDSFQITALHCSFFLLPFLEEL